MTGTNILAIILVIALAGVYILFIVTMARAAKKGTASWIATTIVTLLGLLYILYLSVNINNIEPGVWAQILLLLGLVVVTGMYALSTQKQAGASVKMAEEMKEQRLMESRPYLMLRLAQEFTQLDINDGGNKLPKEFGVEICNAGSGPAVNITVALWRSSDVYPVQTRSYLGPNEDWNVSISTSSVDIYNDIWLPQLKQKVKYDFPGTVAIEYQDIHDQKWVTYLCLQQFDDQNYMIDGEQSIFKVENHD